MDVEDNGSRSLPLFDPFAAVTGPSSAQSPVSMSMNDDSTSTLHYSAQQSCNPLPIVALGRGGVPVSSSTPSNRTLSLDPNPSTHVHGTVQTQRKFTPHPRVRSDTLDSTTMFFSDILPTTRPHASDSSPQNSHIHIPSRIRDQDADAHTNTERFNPDVSFSYSFSSSDDTSLAEPSSISTSFGTPSSFPITRNRGYEDDRVGVGGGVDFMDVDEVGGIDLGPGLGLGLGLGLGMVDPALRNGIPVPHQDIIYLINEAKGKGKAKDKATPSNTPSPLPSTHVQNASKDYTEQHDLIEFSPYQDGPPLFSMSPPEPSSFTSSSSHLHSYPYHQYEPGSTLASCDVPYARGVYSSPGAGPSSPPFLSFLESRVDGNRHEHPLRNDDEDRCDSNLGLDPDHRGDVNALVDGDDEEEEEVKDERGTHPGIFHRHTSPHYPVRPNSQFHNRAVTEELVLNTREWRDIPTLSPLTFSPIDLMRSHEEWDRDRNGASKHLSRANECELGVQPIHSSGPASLSNDFCEEGEEGRDSNRNSVSSPYHEHEHESDSKVEMLGPSRVEESVSTLVPILVPAPASHPIHIPNHGKSRAPQTNSPFPRPFSAILPLPVSAISSPPPIPPIANVPPHIHIPAPAASTLMLCATLHNERIPTAITSAPPTHPPIHPQAEVHSPSTSPNLDSTRKPHRSLSSLSLASLRSSRSSGSRSLSLNFSFRSFSSSGSGSGIGKGFTNGLSFKGLRRMKSGVGGVVDGGASAGASSSSNSDVVPVVAGENLPAAGASTSNRSTLVKRIWKKRKGTASGTVSIPNVSGDGEANAESPRQAGEPGRSGGADEGEGEGIQSPRNDGVLSADNEDGAPRGPESERNKDGEAPMDVDVTPITLAKGGAKLKVNGRSHSAPMTFPSQVIADPVTFGASRSEKAEMGTTEVASSSSEELKEERAEVPIGSSFDRVLSDEIKVEIFHCLLAICEQEWKSLIREWTMARAIKEKWIGRDKGVRELVRASRVSKSWRGLILSGQLWSILSLRASPFASFPTSVLFSFFNSAGQFLRVMDLTGHTRLQPSTLNTYTSLISHQHVVLTAPTTQLTRVTLRGCTSLTARSLHHLLARSPCLLKVDIHGLGVVTNATCEVLARYCHRLTTLDIGRCKSVDGSGILSLTESLRNMKRLNISGVAALDERVCMMIGRNMRLLEALNLSGCTSLTDECVEALVDLTRPTEENMAERMDSDVPKITLRPRDAGHAPGLESEYHRRITCLRHISFSGCIALSDAACAYLAHAVPQLELIELASIGEALQDNGLVLLFRTTPMIRKIDMEEASEITDDVLVALTPEAAPNSGVIQGEKEIPQPGHALEHLVLSYASNLTNDAMLGLIRACSHLRVLELDNTRASQTTVKEFIKLARRRKLNGAEVLAIDCRTIGEILVKDLANSGMTRTRRGHIHHESRKLGYVDSRDNEPGLLLSHGECEGSKVVFKCFWSWQTVDQVKAIRDRRRKTASAFRKLSEGLVGAEEDSGGSRTSRWLSLGRRSASGSSSSGTPSPTGLLEANGDFDERGCVLM